MNIIKFYILFAFAIALFGCGGSNSSSQKSDDIEKSSEVSTVNIAPTVDAGIDQTVGEQVVVIMSGSATDIGGSAVAFDWAQVSGSSVIIENPKVATVSFTSPVISVSETLVFEVTATDNDGAITKDTVNVRVTSECESFDDWSEISLKLNDVDVAFDNFNKRLFLPLTSGYDVEQTLTAEVKYESRCSIALAFNGGNVVNAEELTSISSVRYGSTIDVDFYLPALNNTVSETYEMVFTNLPVIELFAEVIVDDPKSPGTFKLTSPLFDQYTGAMAMGIETRGATSQVYDKKSFSIEIVKDDDPSDEKKLKLLDLRKDGDWILDATYRDKTFARNMIGMDIFNDMRPYAYINSKGKKLGQSAIRGYQAEVILNGRYHGVYMLEEKVDRKLLDMDKVDVPEDDDGNELWSDIDFSNPDNGTVLYKASSNNATLHYISDDVKADFEQKYPKDEDVERYEPLLELISFLNTSTDEEFVQRVQGGDFIDMANVVDFWIMSNVTQNTDTLKKNYYIARNKADKWFFVPWDNDTTFGMKWDGAPYDTVHWWAPSTNKLIQRFFENPETGFNALVENRWIELKGSLFTVDSLTARFIEYRSKSAPLPDVEENSRTRNFSRWPNSGGEGINYPEYSLDSITYIQGWIERRLNFLDDKIMIQD